MRKNILLIALMLLPMVASAEEVEIDGLWYNLVSKAKVAEVITVRTGTYSGDIVIPESVTYDGVKYSVVSISGAFNSCTGLTSISIPNSVSIIGDNAFYGCSSLISITIPNSVTFIGNSAFFDCTGLTSITIPNSVMTIGNFAFYGCSGLSLISIPNSVTSIGTSAFCNCTCLTSINIPNSVTFIGSGAFQNCSGLTSITIPTNVTSIGEYTFYKCSNLTSIDIPNDVTTIGNDAFLGCSSLTSIALPSSLTTIGKYAFYECSGLTSITIPNCVASINDGSFYGCTSLTSIDIPNNLTTIGNDAFNGCTSLTSFSIGDDVTYIGNNAFDNCSNLTTISFGNGITNIGTNAFNRCSSLNSVHINNLSSWCKNTFSRGGANPLLYAQHLFINGEEVHNLIIPDDVTTINDFSFYGCSYLNSVTIGNSVTTIGSNAFGNCGNITDVFSYAETVPLTKDDAFRNSYIQYATLHVPADLVDSYRSTAPWNTIIHIVPIEGEIPKVNKCATPTIEYLNGNVVCNCETVDVKYVYEIAPVTVKRESESGRFAFAPTYEIKVYATREGYKDSDTASIIVSLSNVGDVNGDGQVSIADVTSLVNAILNK